MTTRFIKPAYHSETISLTDRETGAESLAVECTNAAGVLLATLECTTEDDAACRGSACARSQVRRSRTLASRSPGIRSTSTSRLLRTCGSRMTRSTANTPRASTTRRSCSARACCIRMRSCRRRIRCWCGGSSCRRGFTPARRCAFAGYCAWGMRVEVRAVPTREVGAQGTSVHQAVRGVCRGRRDRHRDFAHRDFSRQR